MQQPGEPQTLPKKLQDLVSAQVHEQIRDLEYKRHLNHELLIEQIKRDAESLLSRQKMFDSSTYQSELTCRPQRPVPSLDALMKQQQVIDCYRKNKEKVLDCYHEVEVFKQASRDALKVLLSDLDLV